MTVFLQSLLVRDFRAISGEMLIPLDSPVVLIHAPNAVGKTSVMSAIELGLTGSLPGFERTDRHYLEHLTNKLAASAHIELKARESVTPARIDVSAKGILGEPLLAPDLRQFFSERCYLGQATLSRLLEYYAPADSRLTSALSGFVADLLGVDRLDALIEGLYIAGHMNRVRSRVPAFSDLEQRVTSTKRDIDVARAGLESVREQEKSQRQLVLRTVSDLTGSYDVSALGLEKDIIALLHSEAEEQRLSTLSSARLQVTSLKDAWEAHTAARADIAQIQSSAAEAQKELSIWEAREGKALTAVVERLEKLLTNIPNPQVVEPSYAQKAARAVAQQEFQRCQNALMQNDKSRHRMTELNGLIGDHEERLKKIDGRIANISDSSDSLAQALSAILPHIHSNDCPVCRRNYSEISDEPLRNDVASRVSKLSEQVGLLKSLSSTRSQQARELAALQRERERLAAIILSDQSEGNLRQRMLEVSDALVQLDGLSSAADVGTRLRKVGYEADRRVALSRKHNKTINSIKQQLAVIGERLTQPAPRRDEAVEDVFERLLQYITTEAARLEARSRLRESLDKEWAQLVEARKRMKVREVGLQDLGEQLAALERHSKKVRSTVETARKLARAAVRAKRHVVQRVFTKSLNKTWQELFLRLAPNEPFVPRFVIPDISGSLKIELETFHREAGTAGTPQTMLSTGNLNTAALALFLALNLSAEPRVPLLMLDDPVQSMDEVHTAQLAALLRMMCKGAQSRQIIVAVHERSLFEYLAFELAPSFAGDRLLTVELDRRADGVTFSSPRYHEFKPETAVA